MTLNNSDAPDDTHQSLPQSTSPTTTPSSPCRPLHRITSSHTSANTPICSAKRPKKRNTTLSPMHNASVLKQSDYRSPPTADADSLDGEYGDEESPSSASWVGRKVDAIFSPVLSFLQGASNNSSSNIDGCGEGTRSSSRLQQQSDELPASSTDDKGVVAGSTSSQAREHVSCIGQLPMSVCRMV